MNPTPHPTTDTLRLPWLNRAALRHWTLHVSVSAAPSFAFMVNTGAHWPCVVGMLMGVAFFIVLYTAFARFTYPKTESPSLWRRAIRLGTRIRTGLALLALPGAMMKTGGFLTVFFLPDYFAGLVAWSVTRSIGTAEPVRWLRALLAGPDPAVRSQNLWVGDIGSVLPTFLTTVIEGFLLSALLFLIAFICLCNLKLRDRRVPRLATAAASRESSSQSPTA